MSERLSFSAYEFLSWAVWGHCSKTCASSCTAPHGQRLFSLSMRAQRPVSTLREWDVVRRRVVAILACSSTDAVLYMGWTEREGFMDA